MIFQVLENLDKHLPSKFKNLSVWFNTNNSTLAPQLVFDAPSSQIYTTSFVLPEQHQGFCLMVGFDWFSPKPATTPFIYGMLYRERQPLLSFAQNYCYEFNPDAVKNLLIGLPR